MCIRALDYCPPVEMNFGDYLRAIITADYDLFQDDDKGYRIAFIEAFRRRGIYPRTIRTLSVESLRWQAATESLHFFEPIAGQLRKFADQAIYVKDRQWIFEASRDARVHLHAWIRESGKVNSDELSRIAGVRFKFGLEGLRRGQADQAIPYFEVHNLRPIHRVGPDGTTLNQLIVSIIQSRDVPLDPKATDKSDKFRFRGGCTLILDLHEGRMRLRYAIRKDIGDETRLELTRRYHRNLMNDGSLRATYFKQSGHAGEPFAMLHRGFDH
jgi:hypothetical protein